MNIIHQVDEACRLLKLGQIIAYPTEAVYGLGCAPFNQAAVEKLLHLKQRPVSKGFIVLIANWSQLTPLIGPVPEERLKPVRHTWPGPVTWVFPKAETLPSWLSGDYSSIAIRMTSHPIAKALCKEGPIISTSANLSGREPAVDVAGVMTQFPSGIDAVLSGLLGGLSKPSAIYDVLSGKRWR